MVNPMNAELIAPCGINCRVCRFHMKAKNPCPGCRDSHISGHCLNCKLKNCGRFTASSSGYCYDCAEFPCALVKQLDKRYRTKYGASPIANLVHITTKGINDFLEVENQKWTCPTCGEILCMHYPRCHSCGTIWNR
jgi:hypothetical protein